MSKEALAKVVQRAISDAAFRRQLNSDPTGALKGFNLSADEASAIRTGDAGRLSALGVDQRMSKSFALGGAVASSHMAQSDLPSGSRSMVDDASGVGSRTAIPSDPALTQSAADLTDGASRTVRVGDDWKFSGNAAGGTSAGASTIHDDPDGFLKANANASAARTGDDWKFTDRVAAQGSVAPVEGSPEATAAENAAAGGGMANYPSHDGLAGPSAASSARAGDDWARTSARLDDASAATGGQNAIHDDPDGFLKANADAGGSVTRANVINDDPDGFLAANANADASGSVSRGDGTAFLDESEAYLTKVGYDPSVTESAVTDAHDRTYSGDDIAGPSTDSTSAGEGSATDHGDSSLTP